MIVSSSAAKTSTDGSTVCLRYFGVSFSTTLPLSQPLPCQLIKSHKSYFGASQLTFDNLVSSHNLMSSHNLNMSTLPIRITFFTALPSHLDRLSILLAYSSLTKLSR